MNISAPGRGIAVPGRKRKLVPEDDVDQRHSLIKYLTWMPASIRNHFIAMMGEFVGTFMFLFIAFAGTQVANTVTPGAATVASGANTSNLLYVSLAFGFSLAVNAWVFFRITGGLFNPAVTFGMCLIGAVPWIRGVLVVITQLLGGIAAAGIVSALFPGPENVRTTLGGGTSVVRGLFIEMFLTAELVFTIFMLAAEKHKGTFIAPIGIGLSFFVCEMVGVFFTGGSLNPARSFGPCVIAASFNSYHWIYWVGPLLGSLVAVGFYKLVKGLEYETVNPGQDATQEKEKQFQQDQAEDIDDLEDGRGSNTGEARTGDNYSGQAQHPAHSNYTPAANYSSNPASANPSHYPRTQNDVQNLVNSRVDRNAAHNA